MDVCYLDESLAGFLAQPRHDHAMSISNVVLQYSHVHELLLHLLLALVVQRDKVMRKTPVVGFVLRVQHEEDQIKPEKIL